MNTSNDIISKKFQRAVYCTELTQVQVASVLGYSVSWVQKVSYGSITPPKRVLKHIFETLKSHSKEKSK